MFNRIGQLRSTLLGIRGDKIKIYAVALGIHPYQGRIPKRKDEVIDGIIHKVEISPLLYSNWMARLDAGNPRLYRPSDSYDRKGVDELIEIAKNYGIKSLKHKTKYELIRLIRERSEEEKEEKEEKERKYSR
jgi:hypothetical protein